MDRKLGYTNGHYFTRSILLGLGLFSLTHWLVISEGELMTRDFVTLELQNKFISLSHDNMSYGTRTNHICFVLLVCSSVHIRCVCVCVCVFIYLFFFSNY